MNSWLVPFDPEFVTYVWFDALINYISFAGYKKPEGSDLPEFDGLWPADLQIIGKDILVPAHAIYWPCMLHAMGFESSDMPTLLVHGFWNIRGDKMSKSLGNIVDPDELADKFGPDTVRYYLCRDINSGKDSDFDLDRLVMLFNTELANDLGNLLNRSINMTKGFCNSTISFTETTDEGDIKLRASLEKSTAAYTAAMDNCELSVALQAINDHVTHCNVYLEQNKP
ncbi:class I tRNA ligase family protein, partial [bacterium]|nr:class I tRNA ligase family protein [bacterium]